MTNVKTSLIAALGLLAVGSMAPAEAGVVSGKVAAGGAKAAGIVEITDRGSWIEPQHYRRRGHHDYGHRDYGHRIDRYDGYHHGKRFKKKKRKAFKRGYKRGYGRGYDEGYYEGRRHSRYDRGRRHRHHHYHRRDSFGGGIYFGDGYYGGGSFRFRY